MEKETSNGVHEIVVALKEDITSLLRIKGRLPIQTAIVDEFRSRGSRAWRGINDALLQIVRDSFDMLVIDLCSLRERMCGDGVFAVMRAHHAHLRAFTIEDYRRDEIILGQPMSAASRRNLEIAIAEHTVAAWNERFQSLFPNGAPVGRHDVDELVRRFRKDTEATERDRNRVRAHAFERGFSASYRQTVAQIVQQVEVFERYLNEIYLVLDRTWHSMDAIVYSHPERTAKDLVDLILRDAQPIPDA
jgi:hypothetical protein